MTDTVVSAFEEGLIFSRSDGWENDWEIVVDSLFVLPGNEQGG